MPQEKILQVLGLTVVWVLGLLGDHQSVLKRQRRQAELAVGSSERYLDEGRDLKAYPPTRKLMIWRHAVFTAIMAALIAFTLFLDR